MGTNRKIKSDGNIEIESGTTAISSNATIGGTLVVTGQSTLSGLAFPTSDGGANQVLKTNGSGTISFGDASGRTVTISNQTEANAYTPAESDLVKITGSCTLSSKTINNVNIDIASSAVLTIGDNSTITNSILYGRGDIIVLSSSTHSSTSAVQSSPASTTTIQGCFINVDLFDLQIELTKSTGNAAIVLRECIINCHQYRHYIHINTQSEEINTTGGSDVTTSSIFDNLTILTKAVLARPADNSVSNDLYKDGVAAFSNILASQTITLNTTRVMLESDDPSSDPDENEVGSKTNCKQITTSSM